jgi:type IV pilus assembly protein PilC
MEKIEALKRKGQRAMIYPAIVMSVAVIVVVVLLVFVYPYLREMVF